MKRRDFIKRAGIYSGAGLVTLTLGNTPLRAFARPFLSHPVPNGKILVLLQLSGGNDGLNTVIPYEDSLYYSKRPALGIAKANALRVSDILGLHPALPGIKSLYDQGKVAIIQNVGYDNPNRSHFRATDIWLTASDSAQYLQEGWEGRHLLQEYPNYPVQMPPEPMSIQLGSVESLLFSTQAGSTCIAFEDPNTFFQLVSGSTGDNDPPPNTLAGNELKFIKQVSAQSIQYATVIKQRADAGTNRVTYPSTKLGTQLSIVAKLIAGGMTTPVYLTNLGGFDTHSGQLTTHAGLLSQISEAVAAFQKDLELSGTANKVMLVTFSEFGRRVQENGSAGTDHGTAAPMFVIGAGVQGGVIGNNPNLADLDTNGDLKYAFDYRRVYSTILRNYFGRSASDARQILLRDFETLPFIANPAAAANEAMPAVYALEQNYPNPFNPSTTIAYSLKKPGFVRIKVYDPSGIEVSELVSQYQQAGKYQTEFHGKNLPSGTYIYKITAGGFEQSRKMILIK